MKTGPSPVVVAAEDDADDVLADVVDVALDGRQHYRAHVGGVLRQTCTALNLWKLTSLYVYTVC